MLTRCSGDIVDRVLKEMPTVGLLLALMAVGLLVVIALECRAMGGWRYLAVQVRKARDSQFAQSESGLAKVHKHVCNHELI